MICLFHYVDIYIDGAKVILGQTVSTFVHVKAVAPNFTQ